VRLGGEVQGLQVVPRAGSPSLEVTISDGTGRAVAVFYGRKKLPGVDPGRRMVISGVARSERGRMLLINPAYTLLA
jgi:RecG-like helicase